ncbi:hypothetical protein JL721_10317 [Aureococcus anophagefferens]|nr:hypothetical protein JL721_10317 [Aureococcus anophagefferens]
MLKRHGFEFDEAHTSLLKRATRTLWSVMHSCDQHWIVVKRSWRLNERHYGALTGMSKAEVEAQMGTELLQKFRRGYDKVPIEMRPDHPFWTGRDRRYHDLGDVHPRGESLRMCQSRVLPYWVDRIAPSIRRRKRVLVCAQQRARVLVQHLDSIPPDQIREIEIPTGIPLVYRLDDELRPVGPRDAVGFRGKFLVDSERRDAEYLANAETINHFKGADRVVHPRNRAHQQAPGGRARVRMAAPVAAPEPAPMDPLPIFEPGDMPSMVGANVELAADVEERPKKYIRGASARVPAWTFGQGWAKQTFPSTWHNQMISGTFSRMIEPEYGLFVWDDGDAPAEQKAARVVKWGDNASDTLEGECPFLFKGVHALHNARQALFLLRGVLRKQVPRGISGLDATLMREVKLEVKTADEFDLLFMSARASRDRPTIIARASGLITN